MCLENTVGKGEKLLRMSFQTTYFEDVKKHVGLFRKACLGFYAISTVFQLFNGGNSQIHVFLGLFLTST